VNRLSASSRLLLAFVAALMLVVPLAVATAAPTDPVLPDLVSDPVERPLIQDYSHPDGTDHLLLRFDGYLHNQGPGDLDVRGSQRSGTRMNRVVQRIYRENGSFGEDSSRAAQFLFETADGHNHWHFKDASHYSLWNEAKTAQVAPSQKVGFCLEDTERIEDNGPEFGVYSIDATLNCRENAPTAANVYTGISAGWRDKYTRSLAFQWVDITNVQPGIYWLRSQADPLNKMIELDESNDGAFTAEPQVIPGYVPNPIAKGVVSAVGATTIGLSANGFGDGLGAVRYRIVSAPKHGTLNRAVNATFTTPTVAYTPRNGWLGPDTFTYVAYDPNSPYPRIKTPATVSVNVGSAFPSVAISGAPASLNIANGVQLAALVTADEPGVTWSVNGVAGGNALNGTISPTGLYKAPAQVPASGSVKVRATSASGAYDEETIQIVVPAAAKPAPLPVTAAGNTTVTTPIGKLVGGVKQKTLHSIKIGSLKGMLLVSVKSKSKGAIRIYAHKGKRRIGYCRTKASAKRLVACRFRLPRGVRASDVAIAITLRVDGKLIESVKTRLGAAKRSAAHSHHHHHN
jgi:hypothetical protein